MRLTFPGESSSSSSSQVIFWAIIFWAIKGLPGLSCVAVLGFVLDFQPSTTSAEPCSSSPISLLISCTGKPSVHILIPGRMDTADFGRFGGHQPPSQGPFCVCLKERSPPKKNHLKTHGVSAANFQPTKRGKISPRGKLLRVICQALEIIHRLLEIIPGCWNHSRRGRWGRFLSQCSESATEMKKHLMNIMVVIAKFCCSAQHRPGGCGSVPTPKGEGAVSILQENLSLHFQEGLGDFLSDSGSLIPVPSRHGSDPTEFLVIPWSTQIQGREQMAHWESQSGCGLSLISQGSLWRRRTLNICFPKPGCPS